MIKPNPTMNDVINELMFIAIAKPEKVSVSVRYIGHADALEVIAIDKLILAVRKTRIPGQRIS